MQAVEAERKRQKKAKKKEKRKREKQDTACFTDAALSPTHCSCMSGAFLWR